MPKAAPDCQSVLRTLSFGQRIAEEERDYLANYFVETDQWRRMYSGDVDIVYGAKGSGKSALYFLLLDRSDSFWNRSGIRLSITRAKTPGVRLSFATSRLNHQQANENL